MPAFFQQVGDAAPAPAAMPRAMHEHESLRGGRLRLSPGGTKRAHGPDAGAHTRAHAGEKGPPIGPAFRLRHYKTSLCVLAAEFARSTGNFQIFPNWHEYLRLCGLSCNHT
jgi:hypothetical protein